MIDREEGIIEKIAKGKPIERTIHNLQQDIYEDSKHPRGKPRGFK